MGTVEEISLEILASEEFAALELFLGIDRSTLRQTANYLLRHEIEILVEKVDTDFQERIQYNPG